jgi:pyroglutamyl-peptidase
MERILVTGFEPFGGDSSNPSWTVAQAVKGDTFASFTVAAGKLPVDGARVGKTLERLLKRHEPRAVVMLGLAQRPQVSIERIAVNALDYRVPDNAGRVRSGRIASDGPDGIFSSLPVTDILEQWRASNIPAQLSDTAGTYLCNQAFYLVRHKHPRVMAGFIHLPADETLARERHIAYVPITEQVNAVRVALQVVVNHLERDS